MEQLKKRLSILDAQISEAMQKLQIAKLSAESIDIENQMQQPKFWQDNKTAAELSKRKAALDTIVEPWTKLRTLWSETRDLLNYTSDEPGLLPDLENQIDNVEAEFIQLKQQLRFQGPYDDHAAILSIYAGAGGTDAQDWAQMLLRMYARWAERHGLTVKTIDQSPGDEAGIKSVTLEISGSSYLYGKLAGEHGVHRLVRLSPFNAAASRQTSFAKVDVLPVIDKPGEIELDDRDLKIDVYRAGGHGGQSVNTTDSAVRVTHMPTGIAVAIQNERSQLQNKETALTILRSRLAALQLEQHAATIADVKGPNQSAEFGNQIRNYVLHPYKQIKDLRSGYESGDVQKVLEGNLDPLIDAWLQSQ